MMAKAALLTTTFSTAQAHFVQAMIKGTLCWLRFAGADKDAADATLLEAHRQKMAAFARLQIPNITANTRVLLDIRLTVADSGTLFRDMPVYDARQWSCPPFARPIPAPVQACAA